MFPTLQIGPLALQTPGLALLLALWLGLELMEKRAQRNGENAERLYSLVFTALISGLAGARLFFVAENFGIFAQAPLSLISLNPGLLDPLGGFAAGLTAALIYAQRKALPLWQTLDGLTPLLAALTIGAALSAAAAGTFFGVETTLPWGINLWGVQRHPTQLYGLGLALINLGILSWQEKNLRLAKGGLFSWFVTLTAGGWLFVEALRGDSALLPGGVRLGQVIAWGLLAVSIWKTDFRDGSTDENDLATRQ